MTALPPKRPKFHYPSSDGQPMADNTLQFEWIVTLQGNLDLMYRDVPDVFVAGDHLIYPVDQNIAIRQAPDVYVAFGRPKGHRGSYAVSEEGGIFPQVIFEVWSPSNRSRQMETKREFYEKYGAEEYYLLYPESPADIEGWLRNEDKLVAVPNMNGFVSPLLGIRFELRDAILLVHRPDGRPFLSFVELGTLADQEHALAVAAQERAAHEQQKAEAAEKRAEDEKRRAEDEKRRAEDEKRRAEDEKRRAAKLAARLRELGVDPDAV
jgi:Uma2 family endonuclease